MNKKAKRVTPIKLLCLVMAVMTVGALLLGALTRASYRHDVADAAKSPDTKILYRQKGSLEDEKGGDGGLKETLLKADIIVRAEPIGPEQYQYEAMLVPLRVKQVFRGDIKANDLIDFYEGSFFQEGKMELVLFIMCRFSTRCSRGKNILYLRINVNSILPIRRGWSGTFTGRRAWKPPTSCPRSPSPLSWMKVRQSISRM